MALRTHEIPYVLAAGGGKQGFRSQRTGAGRGEGWTRVDLRSLPLVTIDGEDARDFDDAVYCEKKRGGGWRLWVAIADVSYYVRRGRRWMRKRAVVAPRSHFPSQVVPMLPEVLSNGLCSLNPQVDSPVYGVRDDDFVKRPSDRL
ncbi:RNB domain-containing ribonuclease [Klebsiella pneumoniae subsp. pneumoniae]|nr:RNB domain-containing ribonuclease [Klebsiella pneumoniae subsp. pneumoniae]